MGEPEDLTPDVLVDRTGDVVTVTLNRPERANAIRFGAWADLRAVLADIADARRDRCLVLTGAGDNFCSGGDVDGRTDEPMLTFMRTVGQAVNALHQLPIPTIAKVRGTAAGAGMNLALACDLVVAASSARFSEIFVRRGLSIDAGGSWSLPRRVGLHRAKELVLLGGWVDAGEADRLGLVNRVVPEADLDNFVAGWATQLAAGPPLAMSLDKALLNSSAGVTMEQALEDEARAQTVNFGTRDLREAYKAFKEKRPPIFEGR